MGWYTPKAWARLCELSVDRDKLAHSYEDFVQCFEQQLKAFEAEGYPVTRVLIDPDHMAAWCKRQGISLNSYARAAYGAALAGSEGDKARLDKAGFEDRTGQLKVQS